LTCEIILNAASSPPTQPALQWGGGRSTEQSNRRGDNVVDGTVPYGTKFAVVHPQSLSPPACDTSHRSLSAGD